MHLFRRHTHNPGWAPQPSEAVIRRVHERQRGDRIKNINEVGAGKDIGGNMDVTSIYLGHEFPV